MTVCDGMCVCVIMVTSDLNVKSVSVSSYIQFFIWSIHSNICKRYFSWYSSFKSIDMKAYVYSDIVSRVQRFPEEGLCTSLQFQLIRHILFCCLRL